MRFISRKFPNITACALTFVDGFGETDDKETIEYLQEHGEDLGIYEEGLAPEVLPNEDPFEKMAQEQAGTGWADAEVKRTEDAQEKAEEQPAKNTKKK